MTEKNIGISQQALVSIENTRAKKLPQYLASISASLGALAAGMVLAWTSTGGKNGIKLAEQYQMEISATVFSWIGSLTNLGAGVMCIPIGILCDLIGRKYAMLLMVVPFTVGWLLIILSGSNLVFYFGRFIAGLSVGAFCVASPMYSSEIAESDIRGTLGSYFQLLLTVGILMTYVLGSLVNIKTLSIISAIVPIVFFCVFMFMPESPVYYLKKGRLDSARMSLIRLRGPYYNVEGELEVQRQAIEEANKGQISFSAALRTKAVVKGLIIAFGLMTFQQLSGVNAVIFYAGDIFATAGSDMSPDVSTIVVGVMQVVAVFISTLIVDRLGRRILLLLSIVSMCLTTLVLGVYFYLLQNKHDVSNIKWLPLVSVCAFIVLFSLGFGPIPWMMVSEIFAPEIKGIAASSACLFNWLMAFVVTKFYSDMQILVSTAGTFWIFSGICGVGIFFVYLLVPETKGKSLEDIQRELDS